MSKSIEPGCLCIVVGCINHPDNIGKTVEVESVFKHEEGSWWVSGDVYCGLTYGQVVFFGRHLLRIDDYAPESLEKTENREVPA
ncbi:hypothetical protein [Chromohalobacter sp. 296-RDG]|uniref:hypothetical protein n=1 Tax=Chromohalobacter sp. 296-RDG TaxID=2994062 RepID=UPI0024687B94|nr:hypothetical protein [Chromohalobacter sp. 296-RDG]